MNWNGMEETSIYQGDTSGELAAKSISLFGNGRAGALETALDAVAADSTDFRGWTALALVDMQQDSVSMDSLFTRAYSLVSGSDPLLDEVYAYWLLSVGDLQGAVEYARSAISSDSTFAPGWLTLSMALMDQQLYGEALQATETALLVQPGCIQLLHQYGQVLEAAGQPGEAEDVYREVISLDSGRVSAYMDLGMLLENSKQDGEALKVYRSLLDTAPEYAWAWGETGAILQDMGRTGLADSCFSRSVELDPDDPWTLYMLGKLRSTGNPDSAEALLLRAVEISPEYSAAWQELVFIYESQDDMASAETALRKCVELDREAWLFGELGWVLENTDSYSEAAEAYETSVSIDPQYLYGWQRMGDLYIMEEDFAAAESLFKEAIQVLETEDPWILKNLGRLLAGREEPDSAAVYFSRALAITPSDAGILLDLARSSVSAGRNEDALGFIDSSLTAGGDSLICIAEMLVIQEIMGQDISAETDSLLQEHPGLWIAAGWSSFESRFHDRALDFALKASLLHYSDPWDQISLGELFGELGRSDQLMSCYLEASENPELTPETAVTIANFFFREDMYDASIELLQGIYEREEWDADLTTALAEAYLFNDQLDPAEELLLEVTGNDPYSVYAICYLGLIEENRGNPDLAAEKYLEALRLEPGYPYAQDRLRYISSEDYDPYRRRRINRKYQWSLWLDLSSTGGNLDERNYGGGGSISWNYDELGSSVELETRGHVEIVDGRDYSRTAWASLSGEHFLSRHLYAGASTSWDRQPLTVRPWQVSSYLAAGWKSWPAFWIWLAPETGAGLVSTKWSISDERTDQWTVYTSLSIWARTSVNWLPSLWLSGNVYLPPEDMNQLVANAVGELEFSLPGPLSLIFGSSLDYTRTPVVETWEKLDSELYLRLRL